MLSILSVMAGHDCPGRNGGTAEQFSLTYRSQLPKKATQKKMASQGKRKGKKWQGRFKGVTLNKGQHHRTDGGGHVDVCITSHVCIISHVCSTTY